MENIAQVIRHIRPNNQPFCWWNDPLEEVEEQHYSNLYGITVVFDIDYNTGLVMARWSICNGDNFNKEVGIDMARNGHNRVYFNTRDIEEHKGLVNALVENLKATYTYKGKTEFQKKLNLFRRASRNYREILPEYY